MHNENIKNLYIKSWFLEPETMAERLVDFPFPWKQFDHQFFFLVTPETYEEVKAAITPVSEENGSMIHESVVDYTCSKEELDRQLREIFDDAHMSRWQPHTEEEIDR